MIIGLFFGRDCIRCELGSVFTTEIPLFPRLAMRGMTHQHLQDVLDRFGRKGPIPSRMYETPSPAILWRRPCANFDADGRKGLEIVSVLHLGNAFKKGSVSLS
jgi:hypothetical protein